MREIVLATRNPDKVGEIRKILRGVRFISLKSFPGIPDVKENGKTLRENAVQKAQKVASFTGKVSLADDSGLEVEALGGRPGVRSSRFAGENVSYSDNVRKLLKIMNGKRNRQAKFRCVVALASPRGQKLVREGVCRGRIALSPIGRNGFGYDPVFIVSGRGKTFAQLSSSIKNRISHRAKALKKLASSLAKAKNLWLFFLLFLLFGCAKERRYIPGPRIPKESPKPSVKGVETEIILPEVEGVFRITSGNYYNSFPTWSPDGKKIAYTSWRDGRQNIRVVDLEYAEQKCLPSGKPAEISTGNVFAQDLSWSPDGESILFSSNHEGEYFLYTLGLGERSIKELKYPLNPKDRNSKEVKLSGVHLTCSPLGDKIAFVRVNNIWTFKLGSEKSERYLTISGFNEYPSWGPGGEKIVFSSAGDLAIIDHDSGKYTVLSSPGWNSQPDWSWERDEIAFVSNRGGNYDIWKVKSDGSEPVQLTNDPYQKAFPKWSPDGNWIAFQADYEGGFDVWVMSVPKKKLTGEEG